MDYILFLLHLLILIHQFLLNIVMYHFEIVLLENTEMIFARVDDAQTGYKEIQFKKRS